MLSYIDMHEVIWDFKKALQPEGGMEDIAGGGAGLTGTVVPTQEVVLCVKGSEKPFKDLNKNDVVRSESHPGGLGKNGLEDLMLGDCV